VTRRFIAALVVGLLVRVATLPLPGHDDVITWKIWSYAASHHVTQMYGVGGTPPARGVVTWGEVWSTVDYPPFFLYEYAVVGRIYRALFPSYPDSLALLVAVKLPVLLANCGLTWLFFAVVRRLTGHVEAAQWAALAYWLNPATIFGGEMLGYVDPLYFLPAIAGVALAYFRRPWLAGIAVGIAVGTKPQGILIGPAFALALWQGGGLTAIARASATFAATLGAIIFPFWVRGALPNMWLAFGSFDTRRDTMSAYAANVGWIINWWLRSRFALPEMGFPKAFLQFVLRPLAITRFQELGYPNPRPIARTAVVAAVAWAMWLTRRSRDFAIAAALGAFTIHAFFVLSPGMHEHHQLFEVPLLALAAAMRPRFRPLFYAVSTIVALSINTLYGAGLGMGWALPRMITVIDISVLASFANIGLLIWFARVLRHEAMARSAEAFALRT
jgi:Glycosyltransferase family 87